MCEQPLYRRRPGAVFKQHLFCYLSEKRQQMDFGFNAVIFPVALDVGIQAVNLQIAYFCVLRK